MDYLKIIEKIIASKSKVKILNFLANNPGVYSANYICKYADISPRSSLLSLRDLVSISVVNYKETEGYSLNQENHFVAKMVYDIFVGNRKYIFSKFKSFILEYLEDYLPYVFSILINKKHEVLIVLNLKITDKNFDTLMNNHIPVLKEKLFHISSFAPNILVFKKNFIPHDVYDNWLKVKPVFGDSLKAIEKIDDVSSEEVKKALKFFQVNNSK